jgi:hypothetical protein
MYRVRFDFFDGECGEESDNKWSQLHPQRSSSLTSFEGSVLLPDPPLLYFGKLFSLVLKLSKEASYCLTPAELSYKPMGVCVFMA